MSHLKHVLMTAITMAALIIVGCSSDDPATPVTDTTPPAITGITAVDQYHLDVLFSEAVQSAGAQRSENYAVVEASPLKSGAAAPGDTTRVASAALDNDGKTVHLVTEQPMSDIPYVLGVTGIKDMSGNPIGPETAEAFTGNPDPDTTPPTIIDRAPAPGATGVGIGQAVEIQFSEPMDYTSVLAAFSWGHGGAQVQYSVDDLEGNIFIFTPQSPLANNTLYTVTVTSAAQDWSGNGLVPAGSWTFTTTGSVDTTPPTLVSSTPANNAVNVAVGANLVFTFSEAVEQNSLDQVLITPDIGDGVPVWSNGGKTITFDPYVDMMAGTTYNLVIPPGGVRDLAGNGNTALIQIVWSTGSTLATGSFSGTLSGPGSAAAANPAGAIVIAADTFPFGVDDFGVVGSGLASASGRYAVANLPDGTFWPICFLETNDDGEIDPSLGDAFGAYGLSFDPMSGDPVSITISGGGERTNIDFPIYDPMAFAGTFEYTGSNYTGCCYQYYVGLFETAGFDINNPGDPAFGTYGNNWPGDNSWYLDELDYGLQAGTYYVGAYLDGNGNQNLDPGEPIGFIGGNNPTPFTVGNGSDQLGLIISLGDSAPGLAAWSNWSEKRTPDDGKDQLRRLVRAFKATVR